MKQIRRIWTCILALVFVLGSFAPAMTVRAEGGIPAISGDTVFAYAGGDVSAWNTNTTKIAESIGSVDGTEYSSRVFALGYGNSTTNPLFVTTPAFTVNTADYEKFSVSVLAWDNGSDKDQTGLVLQYSVDGGASWTDLSVTTAAHANAWTSKSSGNTFTLYSHTVQDAACPASAITNIRILPYGSTVYSGGGAFRLAALKVTASGTAEPEVPVSVLPKLSGDTLLYVNDGTIAGWTDNSSDIRGKDKDFKGTLEGAETYYTIWPLGSDRPGAGKKLQITSPALTGDSTAYKSFCAQALVWTNATDPKPNHLVLYYSADGGSTWTAVPVTVTEYAGLWNGEFPVYAVTAKDVACPAAKITNLMLQPYGDTVNITTGAFRLISLHVTGSQTEGTVPPTPEPEPEPDPVRDDAAYIQGLIDNAVPDANGIKVVTVPAVNPNDPDGGNVYQIGTAIEIPSNTTVKLDNCTLRLNDGVLCNIFISDGLYDGPMTEADEVKNIKIIGIGNAVLDGGNHNGVTEKTATKPDGYSTVRHNHSIFFRNVDGFEISNLKIVEPRYWGICFNFCENGKVSGIHFDCSNKAPNQDGIDLRIGCNNIEITDITGVTGDDTVALTALSSAGGSDVYFAVSGKSSDIHDVTMKNIKATCNGGHGIIRLLCHHGNKVYNIHMENIEDTGTNHVQGVLRIGDTNYAGSGTPMAYGDMHDITVDGVISNGIWAIHAPNTNVTNKHVTYQNITVKYGGVTNLTIEKEPVTATPITYLTGETIFAYTGGSEEGWGSNAGRTAVTNSGKLEEKDAVATVWPLGSTAADTALALTTPKFAVDTAPFESYKVHLVVLDNGDDPDLSKLILSVSVDNGATWTDVPLTMTNHGPIWSRSDGTTREVHDYVSGDLTELISGTVTHIRIKPFGDQYIQKGAFRLLSMDVKGEKHELTHYPAMDANCTDTGNVEYWYCADCDAFYLNAEGTNKTADVTVPVDPDAHALEKVAAKAATTEAEGNIEHWRCRRCEAVFADAEGKQKLAKEDVILEKLKYDLDAILEPVKDITEDNVAAEDEEALTKTKEALDDLQEAYDDQLTDEEAARVEAARKQIEAAQKVLDDAEAAKKLLKELPATAAPDDADALEAYFEAKKAYDALSEHGKSLVDEAAVKKLTDLGAALVDYKFLSGDKAEWTSGSSKALTFKANGMFSKFAELEIDGKKVDPANYTVAEGSTVITLKEAYLKTLKVGEHTITAVYPDGRAEGSFTVKAATSSSGSPVTGDIAKPVIWISVLAVSAAAAAVLLLPKKRKAKE
ncbi:MAG: hypothetical protein IJP11_06255 [Oscillospiraceae bacterium]|nr:hypothetical protein [Oscillospiraceae bacterium]